MPHRRRHLSPTDFPQTELLDPTHHTHNGRVRPHPADAGAPPKIVGARRRCFVPVLRHHPSPSGAGGTTVVVVIFEQQ